MESTNHIEDDGEDNLKSKELIQSNTGPSIKHLNALWDTRFEKVNHPLNIK